MPKVKTKVNNVIISATYRNTEFDLEKLARKLNARYDPEIFPGISYRSEEPRAAFLIFASGKMNCVGAKSIKDAKLAIKNLTRKLQRFGVKIKSAPEIKVQNIVGTINFNRRFDLEKIASDFKNTEYNPEVFPGLVFRLNDPKVVVLLFVGGRCVCAGAKSGKDVERAAEMITKLRLP